MVTNETAGTLKNWTPKCGRASGVTNQKYSLQFITATKVKYNNIPTY